MEKKEDVKVVVGNKKEDLWQRVKTTTEQTIQNLKNDIEINEEILKIANKKTKGISSWTLGKRKR